MSRRNQKKIEEIEEEYEEEEVEVDEEEEEEDDDIEVEEDEEEEEEEEEEDSVDEYEIHVYDETGKEIFDAENDDEWIVDADDAADIPVVEKVHESTSRFWNWLREDYIESHGGIDAVRRRGPIYVYEENEMSFASKEKDEEDEKVGGKRKEKVDYSLFDKNIEGDENIEKKFNEVVEKTKQKDRDELPYYLIHLENKSTANQLKFKIACGLIHVTITNFNRTKRPGSSMDVMQWKMVKNAIERIHQYLAEAEIVALMKDRSIANKLALILSRFIEDEVHSLKLLAYPSESYSLKIKDIIETINHSLFILSLLKNIISTLEKETEDFVLLFIDLGLSILKAIHCFPADTTYIFEEKTYTLRQMVAALAVVIYNESKDDEVKQMAFLCHTAYLALQGDYSGHKLLISFPTSVHSTDIPLQIYQNRANALTALSAFKDHRYDITYILLHDLIETTSHVQTCLGQVNLKSETKSIPKHMFIDVALLKSIYYISAVLSEDGEHPMNYPVYKKMVENKREVVVATSTKLIYYTQTIHAALMEGNWQVAIEFTKKLLGSSIENVDFEHIQHLLKQYALRSFVKLYSKYFTELSAQHLADLFELPVEEAQTFILPKVEKEEIVEVKKETEEGENEPVALN